MLDAVGTSDVKALWDGNQQLVVNLQRPLKEIVLEEDEYNLPVSGKGLALIINIFEYSDGPSREGSDQDVKNMMSIWSQLGYEVYLNEVAVLKKRRWCKPEFEKTLDDFVKQCQTVRPKSIVIFVGSLGEYNTFYMSDHDPEISNNENVKLGHWKGVIEKFNSVNYPELECCPKIFIFQSSQDFVGPTVVSDVPSSGSIRNAVVISATSPGGNAYRNPSKGSYFVYILTYCLMQYAHAKCLQEISGEVMKEMSRKMSGIPSLHVPDIKLFELKRLYFPIAPHAVTDPE